MQKPPFGGSLRAGDLTDRLNANSITQGIRRMTARNMNLPHYQTKITSN